MLRRSLAELNGLLIARLRMSRRYRQAVRDRIPGN